MRIVHFCAGQQFWNGMANTARQFVTEELSQGKDSFLADDEQTLLKAKRGDIEAVYIHGAWLPVLWRVARQAKRIGAKLFIRPAGSYDPVRLAYHGWKKKLVSFFEHRMLRLADTLLATCEAERKWIREYVGRNCPKIEVTDLKRFFDLADSGRGEHGNANKRLNLLYLGRRHPLKGVEYLEQAVKELAAGCRSSAVDGGGDEETEAGNIVLKIVSNAKGDELEKVWQWCDVLALPTLSENFGRVVAEALERGKRVITTDGAPAWGEGCSEPEGVCSEFGVGYGGRLIYLKGYRDGTRRRRVELLKEAIRVTVSKV